jgi:hypothetical protein
MLPTMVDSTPNFVMKKPDIFIVRGKRCPCICDENGVLVFLACPNCGRLILVCDEVGNAFDNLDNLLNSNPLVVSPHSEQNCPQCEQAPLNSFRLAEETDLRKAGISEKRYEAAGHEVAQAIRVHCGK